MPNPYGRSGAKMQEPTKDDLRRDIETLRNALYVAQRGREQAERRLKEIEGILNARIEEPTVATAGHVKDYYSIVDRAIHAGAAEGGGVCSFELWGER